MDSDLSSLNNFHLVGVRFSRLSVDERAMSELGATQLEIGITIGDTELSKHLYGERKVIEISVSAVAVREGAKKERALAEVFNLECTAGFVGATDAFDGNVEAFELVKSYFARSIYWILRERIDSVFAVTVLRGSTRLPWDIASAVEPKPAGGPTKAKVIKRVAAKKAAKKASR